MDLLVSAAVHEVIATEEVEKDKSMAIGSKRPLRDTERVKTGIISWLPFRTEVALLLCSAGGCYLLCNM